MHTLKNYLLISLLLLAHACDQSRFNIDVAIIPREVTNLTDVNSTHDDFNSAGPLFFASEVFTLVFSSNRNSNGTDFDLVSYQCYLFYDQVNISFDIWQDPWDYPVIDTMNGPYNEWGPYLTFDILNYYYGEVRSVPDTARIFFSSDREGDQDIYYYYYSPDGELFPQEIPVGISGLNTEYEEGYLCLHQDTLTNIETCYFTSDRTGNFDIYRATGEANKRIETSGSLQVTRVEMLSGVADDKCPYIVNDMMVFTSNRDGGYGGFDLWYAVFNDGSWSAPVNFGPEINSQYDEYRPVIIPTQPELFLNDMLIFSSNRPGGKGGFDLYYTGMDKHGTYE
jgi:hypothetical protein